MQNIQDETSLKDDYSQVKNRNEQKINKIK